MTSDKANRAHAATVDRVIARLRSYARSQNWSKGRFAREAGLSDTVLNDFWADDWSPTARTLRSLEIIVPDSFRPPPEGEPTHGTHANE